METNWYKKRVDLNSPGSHTIAVMEWIRANNCPNIDHTMFYNDGRYEGIVSRKELDELGYDKKYIELCGDPFDDAFEYNGMKRIHDLGDYVFLIDGNAYLMTI